MADEISDFTSLGLRKAAILLVSLEQDVAAQIMAQMNKEEIEQLSREIAALDSEIINREERDRVIEEFYYMGRASQSIEQGGVQLARQLLEKVLPADEAARIVDSIEKSMRKAPFGFLAQADSNNILTFIQDEHPQTISLILAYLTPAQAAQILEGLPPRRQLEVVKRLATMERTSPEVVNRVERSLEIRLAAFFTSELHEAGGVQAAASILNLAGRSTERAILENLEEEDPELVDQIRRLMFVFEDIARVNERGVQNLLKQIDHEQLALGLKTASPELQDKFFRNMSKRAAESIQEEMSYMGPVRLADVEQAQQAIVDMVRRLEEQGELIIEGRGADEIVV